MIDANTNINDLVTGLEPDVPADNGLFFTILDSYC